MDTHKPIEAITLDEFKEYLESEAMLELASTWQNTAICKIYDTWTKLPDEDKLAGLLKFQNSEILQVIASFQSKTGLESFIHHTIEHIAEHNLKSDPKSFGTDLETEIERILLVLNFNREANSSRQSQQQVCEHKISVDIEAEAAEILIVLGVPEDPGTLGKEPVSSISYTQLATEIAEQIHQPA
jgi:uncharacterized protein YqgV (UPF0045/DUF77 family)